MNTCAQIVADYLDGKGLTYSVVKDGSTSVLAFPYKQRRTNLIFSGDNGTQCQLQTVIESVPEDKVIDVIVICNKLNAQYRIIKLVVDDDNDLMCYSDAILDPDTAGDECFEVLLRSLKIIEDVKPVIMRGIYS